MRLQRWTAPSLRGPSQTDPGRTLARIAVAALALGLGACEAGEAEHTADTSQVTDAAFVGGDAAHAAPDAAVPQPTSSDASTSAPGEREAGSPPAPLDASAPTNDADAASIIAGDAALADAANRDASPEAGGDLQAVAAALHGLFLDVPCEPSTPTPLANGATCLHPAGTQHIEKPVTLAGEAGAVYAITLRVRGIWEPTLIQGGQHPDKAHPLTIGGMSPPGTSSSDAINYQQYSLQVSEPKQTYWLNDHQYVAHAIHKEDYQATIRAAAGARVTVVMNDGNERQIANFTKAFFEGLAPYDKAPSTGQFLRLDVMSVSVER